MAKSTRQKNVLYLPFSYGPEFYLGIARYAAQHGWLLNADMAWTGHIPYGWSGDGVISLLTENEEGTRFVQRLRMPVVDIAHNRPDVKVARVTTDNLALGRLAARHFLELGWRHFAFISRTDNHASRLRAAGYREDLKKQGHTCHEYILPRIPLPNIHHWDTLSRYLTKELRRLPKPLAVMTCTDYDAAMLINFCLPAGLHIPDQIGVIGADNNSVVCDGLPVTLSSVDPGSAMIGYQAAALLDKLMRRSRPPGEPILIPPHGVVMRQSSNRYVIADPRLDRAVDLMNRNLDQNLSLEQIADQVGLSRKSFYVLFKRAMQELPAEFLRRRRLELAQRLLAQTEEKLPEIARQCGMSPITLIRQFRREQGKTPQLWRAEQRAQAPQ